MRFKYFWRNNKEKDLVQDLHSLIFSFLTGELLIVCLTVFDALPFFFFPPPNLLSHCVLFGSSIKHGFKFQILYGNGRTFVCKN